MKNLLRLTLLFGLTTGAIGIAFAGGVPAGSDADGVRQAVRFERAKDAADARQARQQQGKTDPSAAPKAAATTSDGGMQAAIRFERAKQAADAQQARVESADAGKKTHTTVTAARR